MGPHYAYVKIGFLGGEREGRAECADCGVLHRSSNAALHGLIYWISQCYGMKGVTCNE